MTTTNVVEKVQMSPSEFFKIVSEKKYTSNNDDIANLLTSIQGMMEKALAIGQDRMVTKLYEKSMLLLREKEAVEAGYTTYVLRDDVCYYITNVAKQVVKIVDLEDYVRDIPESVVEKILDAKKIFDHFVVCYTDYTGEKEREVEKEKRDKDPILFGCFMLPSDQTIVADRLYFVADWVDEFCDLTFDKMVTEYEKTKKEGMTYRPAFPKTDDEIKSALKHFDVPDPSITEYAIRMGIKEAKETQEKSEETKKPTRRGRRKKTS